ncbi:hypothetical protein, partial [Streptomyces sp. NPDC047130]|uniref:hypothetical protein n=1 Tax=Streptomyces sp. NPDC047130 TaxID=3155261 RepID=UPI0033E2F2D5
VPVPVLVEGGGIIGLVTAWRAARGGAACEAPAAASYSHPPVRARGSAKEANDLPDGALAF